jgi:hypothetical protein
LLLASAAAAPAGYAISRSLRFNSADSAYLSRTPSSAGNRKIYTFSFWIKRVDAPAGISYVYGSFPGATTEFLIGFNSSQQFYVEDYPGSTALNVTSSAVFRDFSAWYHFVVAVDTTQATAANRIKLYVNGSQITQLATATYPTQNFDTNVWNTGAASAISARGRTFQSPASHFLADLQWIDGQALDPTSFGEFDDNGIWQPKAYSGGSYGTNGFHLTFSDNSTAGSLGDDTSGSGNNWTVNNITATLGGIRGNYWASTTTSPGLPFPTGNPPSGAFDGSDPSTGYAAFTGTWAMDWSSLLTSVSPSSTFKIYLYPRLGTVTVTINGTNTYGPYSGDSKRWESLGFTGTINTISIVGTDSFYWGIGAFEVDGSRLIDPIAEGVLDSLVDVPTNGTETDSGLGAEVRGNYCTWNALAVGSASDLAPSNGNLDATGFSVSGNRNKSITATIGVTSGKWYWEVAVISVDNAPSCMIGISSKSSPNELGDYPGANSFGWSYYANNGTKNNGTQLSYGASYTAGDVIGVALDIDNGTLTFYKNNISQGTAYTGLTNGPYYPAIGHGGSLQAFVTSTNFGQRQWAYQAPAGFKALCTANLPAPVVTKPSEYMDVKLYTGNGSTQTISGLQFSPDLVWVKSRSSNVNHFLYDQVRGFLNGNAYELRSSQTNAESVPGASSTGLTAFNSDGFSLGSDSGANTINDAYVAWTWDAGSSTVTNTDGSITSTVRANPSAGFSVVTYTGTGSNATVGHGLNVAPSLIIVKCRSAVNDWAVYHAANTADPKTDYLLLNSTAATADDNTYWNDTAPTSTVFSIGTNTDVNTSTATYVAYCWTGLDAYTSMSSYTGNGSADGRFVFTNMRPRWILIKRTDTTGDWTIIDTAREGYNVDNDPLFPNLSNAEGTTDLADILSNGFKLRSTDASVNASAGTYIYFAIAETGFSVARAR